MTKVYSSRSFEKSYFKTFLITKIEGLFGFEKDSNITTESDPDNLIFENFSCTAEQLKQLYKSKNFNKIQN